MSILFTMNNQKQKSIKETVLEKIKSGQIKMRPKLYFISRTILLVLGFLAVAAFILLLASFIMFSLRINGLWFLPGFGFRGFGMFLNYLPWILILITLILIAILEILAKRFSFVYRRPVVYSLIAIILIVFLGSFIIYKTPLHPGLFIRSREGNLPFAGPIYRGFGMPELHDVHQGIVEELTENGFRIRRPDNQLLTVIVTPDTQFPSGKEIKQGDMVVVMGERDDGNVRAFGIRKIEDEFKIFERRLPMPMPKP